MRRRSHPILLFVLTLAMALGAGCSKESRRERYLERANRYYEARELSKATIEYLNAAKLDPENPICIQRLGQIYFTQGQLGRAHALLKKSHDKGGAKLEVMIPLLRIYREAHDAAGANRIAAEILQAQPGNEEALLTLAGFAVTPEQDADLEARVAQLRAVGGNDAVYHLATGIISLKKKKYDEAEQAFKQALALNPKSPFIHSTLGNFYFMRGKVEAAREEYLKQLEADPKDLFARIHFAEFGLMTGDRAEARKDLELIAGESPDFVPAKSLLASLALDEKRFDDCAKLVNQTLAQEPTDFRAMLVRGRLSLSRTNASKAILEFQQLQRTYPRVPQVHVELARAYLATNDLDHAVSALNEALAVNPTFPDALFLKGQVTFRQGDYASAQAAFVQLIQQNPNFIPGQLALAEVHQVRGALDDALTIYRNLAVAFPSNAQPLFLEGIVYRQQGQVQRAENALARALQLETNHLPALHEMLDLKTQQRDFPAAEKLVGQLETLEPKRTLIFFARARLLLAQKDIPGAEKNLREAIRVEPDFSPAYEMLSSIYVSGRREAEALASLDQTLTQFPDNINALLQKAVLLSNLSNYLRAAEAYERVLAKAPQSVAALNNLAYLYSEKLNKLDAAHDLARKARQLAPEEPTIADTLGWILYLRREYSQALPPLSEAAARLPKNPEIQFHAGMANYMQGDETKAEGFLRRALELSQAFNGVDEAKRRLADLAGLSRNGNEARAILIRRLEQQPDDPIALRRLAEWQMGQADWPAARVSLERLLDVTPQSVPALLKLASLYVDKFNNPQKAFDLTKEARKLAPGNAEVAQSLGRLAVRCGDSDWAVSLFQEQVQKQPSAERLYDLGFALYTLGRLAEAQENVGRSLQLSPAPAQATISKQFLALTDATNSLNPDKVLVDQARTILSSDTNFLPAIMIISAAQTQAGEFETARRTYTRLVSQYPKFTPALRALVLLPVAAGKETQNYELVLKARKVFPRDPAVALAAGRAHFGRGDFASARLLLQEAVAALPE
ncbi:MAG: tetratricopeptide repeat protein, partial [Akkermansiaceae bacterium]|nr:tetratricopeptide repeat protein [Verrucomicrobiales bacterium]